MSLQAWLPLNGNLNNQGLANLTFSNYGAIPSTDGKIGMCYSFGGEGNGYIISNDNINFATNSKMSVACWVKFEKSYSSIDTKQHVLIDLRDAQNNLIVAICQRAPENSTDNLYIYSRNNSGNNTYSVLVSDISGYLGSNSTWHHFVFTFTNNNKINVYIDGQYNNSIDKAFQLQNNIKIALGRSVLTPGNTFAYWDGKLNDVRIYNHCLSLKEIEELSKGLILHYQLKGNQPNWILPEPDITITRNSTNASYVNFDFKPDLKSCPRTSYIVDFFAKGSADDMEMDVYFRNSSGNAYASTVKQTLTRSWVHYSLPLEGSTSILDKFRARCYKGTAGDTVIIRNMRLLFNKEETIHDCSGFLYNGNITGDLGVFPDSPKYDSSIYFDGSSYILANNFLLECPQQLTLSTWIKYGNIFGNPITLFDSDSTSQFYLYDRKFYFKRLGNSGSAQFVDFGTMESNKWYHLVATYDNGKVTTYKNGSQVATSNNTGPLANIASIRIGTSRFVDHTSYIFYGYLSDVRIYATAISAAAVKELYQTSAQIDSSGNLYTRELIEQ